MPCKKIVALLLAALLTFSSVPLAFANDFPVEDEGIQQEEPSVNEQEGIESDDINTLSEEEISDHSPSDMIIPEASKEQLGSSECYDSDGVIVVMANQQAANTQFDVVSEDFAHYAQIASQAYGAGNLRTPDVSAVTAAADLEIELLDNGTATAPMALVEVPEELSVEQAVAIAEEVPGVVSVQPNYLLEISDSDFELNISGSSNDSYLRNQANYQWSLYKTNVLSAWDNPIFQSLGTTMTTQTTTVAVIDTGTLLTHADLAANLDTVNAWDAYNDCPLSQRATQDIDGHGTMVAGFTSAVTNNTIGVAGPANNRVRVLPINVFYPVEGKKPTASTSELIKALSKVIEYKKQGVNIRVINMSLGGYFINSTTKEVENVSYADAVRRTSALWSKIVEVRSNGILAVAAAGNEGADPAYKNPNGVNCFSFPSDYNEVLSVTSTDINDARASSSSFNQYKDIAAPGVSVASTSRDGGYGYGSGTSYASPLVASIAAVLFASDPTLSPKEVADILCESSEDLAPAGRDDYFGYGRLDAAAAINELSKRIPHANVANIPNQMYSGLAITPAVEVRVGEKLLAQNVDYTLSYSNNINPTNGGAQVTITGRGNYSGKKTVFFSIIGATIETTAHVQKVGWIDPVANGGVTGTAGRGLRMEALQVNLINNTGLSGKISYASQIQTIGWQEDKSVDSTGQTDAINTGEISGTSGLGKRLETFSMHLSGSLKDEYDIYYRAHVQSIGWMGWACNGEYAAGSVGLGLRMEALQIYLCPKGTPAPANTFNGVTTTANTPCVVDSSVDGVNGALEYNAMVHVQTIGDVIAPDQIGSTFIGTSGRALRLEALSLELESIALNAGLSYEVHVQKIGWQGMRQAGELAGTQGQGLRLEAIRINLTEELASNYDVYYRTHIQSIGWTGWARNGQSCGSAGYGYRMEAMQIVFVEKNTVAPGINNGYFHQK